MATVDRRTLLRGAAIAAVGGPFAGFIARSGCTPRSDPRPAARLRPVPDKRDGEVRLHLPRDFGYRSFHDTGAGAELDDGTVLPGRHDGMAAFRGPHDTVVLIRNHEVNGPGAAFGPGTPYDPHARGGTTTVEVTPRGEVRRAYTSLNGTVRNCGGGPMPWGAWVSCEETVNGPDVGPDFSGARNTSLAEPHGFIYEVPVGGESSREPITRAGRFAHEAAAFDPGDGIVYLTEDNFGFPSGFYRYR
ncbi:MAG: alkaline phosphatase PhoX, partial [Micromonosporaceae bacterium]